MADDLTREDRRAALAELVRIEETLAQMAGWLDNGGEERASILLEDAWKNVSAAGWLLERTSPAESAQLIHRRTS
ncbi:MAG TPA: hypothetical protein VMV92_44365 [Streptosporangiaceae bacterium]|nr:hypothetical protein [Streptosporangiaceae bacterium]HVB44867.1 hypothetical protein [Streptosporangiaceae bacterium]